MALDLPSRNNGGSGDALPPHLSPFALLAHVLYDCNGVFPDPLPYEWHHLQALGSPGRDEEISPLHPNVWDIFWFASAFCVERFLYLHFLESFFVLIALFLL